MVTPVHYGICLGNYQHSLAQNVDTSHCVTEPRRYWDSGSDYIGIASLEAAGRADPGR